MSLRTDVFALSDAVVDAVAAARPVTATFWGVPGHDDRWDDLSPEGHDALAATLRNFRARVPAATGEPWADLARDVLLDYLDTELARHDAADPLSDLNAIASPCQLLRMVFDVMDGDGVRPAVVARMRTMSAPLEGYLQSLLLCASRGQAPAARQVRAAIAQARVAAGPDSWFRGAPASWGEDAAVDAACAAWARFAERLEAELLPMARTDDPVGRARYLREARRHLGAALDADEAYAWGWAEIDRLRARMEEAGARIAPGLGLVAVLDLLRTDPAYALPDVDALVAFYRHKLDEALPVLAAHFDIPEPVRRLDVHRAPPGGPIGAYYIPPSDGFTRPGTVWIAHPDGPAPRFDQASTAYHEGFPGHHLQLGVQVAAADRLSRLHRVAEGPSGHAEGWALYAEQLMDELGFFSDPVDRFGMLACQMIRACRVVIDIGCHLELPIPPGQPFHAGQPWTVERGVEMLTTLGGLTGAHARSEMDRYLGWPAQAITYKLGQRAFLALRDEARRRPGFDLKDFHRRVLACGTLGLDRLRGRVLGDA